MRAAAAMAAYLWLAAPALAQEQTEQDRAPRREWQRTIASASLQDELRPRVLAAASARLNDPACRRVAVADTAFNGWTGAPVAGVAAPGRPWEETWIVDLCGRIADVLVQFTPGAAEILVAVPPEATHLRP